MKLLALVLLAACATGPIRQPPRAGTPNAKLVERVVWFTSPLAWQRSPWFRIAEDPSRWPHRAVLARDGTLCAIPDFDIYEPMSHEYYKCSGKWLLPR